jgi:hypothetical protein
VLGNAAQAGSFPHQQESDSSKPAPRKPEFPLSQGRTAEEFGRPSISAMRRASWANASRAMETLARMAFRTCSVRICS